jgi:hypothetical protein
MIQVGHEFPAFRYEVEKTKADEFRRAIHDESGAAATGSAPIGMIFFVVAQDSGEVFRAFDCAWDRLLFGGVTLEYQAPVRVGDVLHGRTRFSTYREHGAGENLTGFAELETRYHDDGGREVLVETTVIVVRGGLPQPEVRA